MRRTGQRRGFLTTYAILIVFVTLLTAEGAFLALIMRPDRFVSSARVVVRPESLGGGAPVAPVMGTELQIAKSGLCRRDARSALLDVRRQRGLRENGERIATMDRCPLLDTDTHHAPGDERCDVDLGNLDRPVGGDLSGRIPRTPGECDGQCQDA